MKSASVEGRAAKVSQSEAACLACRKPSGRALCQLPLKRKRPQKKKRVRSASCNMISQLELAGTKAMACSKIHSLAFQ